MISKSARSFALALATLTFSGAVFAGEIYFSFRESTQTVSTGDVVPVLLKNSGSEKLVFWTYDDNQTVAVFFNSECTVRGETSSYLSLKIKIDGTAVKPSKTGKALCTGRGADDIVGWVGASSNVAKTIVDAGKHKVKVEAFLSGWESGEQFRLDDTSVIVIIGDDAPLVIK